MAIRTIPAFFFCIVALALTYCAQQNDEAIRITERDDGSSVRLREGQVLTVALEGNPTTGYTWEASSGVESILQQQGEPGFEPRSNLPGAGGLVTIEFKAIKQGEGVLRLIYRRSFEPGVDPLKRFEVTIAVCR
jgi:predicted secreted protein